MSATCDHGHDDHAAALEADGGPHRPIVPVWAVLSPGIGEIFECTDQRGVDHVLEIHADYGSTLAWCRDSMQAVIMANGQAVCGWWAGCGEPAITTRPHPVLRYVPICRRCSDRCDRIETETGVRA